MTIATVLTDRFDRALLYATHVHGGQVRKGTSTPYVSHLLAVAVFSSNLADCADREVGGLCTLGTDCDHPLACIQMASNSARFCSAATPSILAGEVNYSA
jgi:hypothetical protein